ncbi:MAG: glycosyltransferase family 4 protein [Candidatus Bathyarchaeia archaeon]|jgi:glycosyltransferase involved in cell wall biosynthesis
MRVCIFGSEIGPVKKGVFVGGATVSAVRLGQALHNLGDDIFVFSSAPRGRPSRVYSFDWGVIVNKRISGSYMSLPYLLLYGITSFFGLLHFCTQNKIETLSSHSGSMLLCVVPSVVGKILRIPVVHTQYCELSKKTDGFANCFRIFIRNSYLFMPDRFVGISKNVYNSLVNNGISCTKVVMIPPVIPVYTKCGRPLTRYRCTLGCNDSDLLALFVGNLKHNKGIDVLFRAFINLSKEIPNLKLIITTELVHKHLLNRKDSLNDMLAQHGLADRVVWLGFVDDIISLLSEVDVVVVPFLNLNGISDYPLVVLEAMAVGTPVVATDVGGTSEVLCENVGVLVPSGDVNALSKGILDIIRDKSSFYCGNKFGFSLNGFGEDSVGQKYHSLFLEEVSKVD